MNRIRFTGLKKVPNFRGDNQHLARINHLKYANYDVNDDVIISKTYNTGCFFSWNRIATTIKLSFLNQSERLTPLCARKKSR